jgi:hypothetical protein
MSEFPHPSDEFPHPLFGFPAVIAWLPKGRGATDLDFHEATKDSPDYVIERWYSVRDAVKNVIANPKPGFDGWIMTQSQIFNPTQIHHAWREIMKQDRENTPRS